MATSEPSFHPSFPPQTLVDATNAALPPHDKATWRMRNLNGGQDADALARWFEDAAPTLLPMGAAASARENQLWSMSAVEYIAARRSGETSCEEYTTAALKRMHHYRQLNAFMMTSYDQAASSTIMAQARALDQRAATGGVESIAPFFGLPIPLKGTAATVDFPSSAGSGVLDSCYAAQDCDLVQILKKANAIIMGKTNVPEFAASWLTVNHTNGVCWNPYVSSVGALTTGGSSGGAAVAVAAHIVPLAVTEDTGGSTRHPANQCGNFGYDPPRNKYPNNGNPGITFYCDQLGLNARSFGDILLYDAVVTGCQAEHAAARNAVRARPASDLRVGFPQEVHNGPDLLSACLSGWLSVSSCLLALTFSLFRALYRFSSSLIFLKLSSTTLSTSEARKRARSFSPAAQPVASPNGSSVVNPC